MPSAERVIRLGAKDHIGRARINAAKRRLKHWDGRAWVVTAWPVPESNNDRIHVRPQTDQATDWLGFWVLVENDPHVVVAG